MTILEFATCVVTGSTLAIPGARPWKAFDPVTALERAVEPALRHAPCLVSFSGGHDSSLLLAAATRVARRQHLALPIPVTWRATDAPLADESAIQEEVVQALGLRDWIRLQSGDDLDFVGPIATNVLRRHGLLYPANAYFHAPLLKEAYGGALLTGFGGDQVLGRLPRPRRPSWWPSPGGPNPLFTWLSPSAAEQLRVALRREARARPSTYSGRLAWAATRRDLALTRQSLALLAGDAGAEVAHPLLDADFLRAMIGTGMSPEAAGGRAGLISQVFGGVYPDAVVRPRPKARFSEVFWRRHTRKLIGAWDGTGMDESVVDRPKLRSEWERPQPDLSTALLVQQLRLTTMSSGSAP